MGIPQRLLDSMAEIAAMPPDENQALAQAIVESFGPCVCQTYQRTPMGNVWVEMCAGHAFIQEQDTSCSRIEHLRFARARREHWRRQEWMTSAALFSHDLGL